MIQSERDREWHEWLGYVPRSRFIFHRFKGGPPPKRLLRLQTAHEGRARRYGVPWDTVDLRDVYAKTKGLCGICLQAVSLEEFTVDVPLIKGGPHVLSNLQPAHRGCNSKKGSR